MSRKSYAVVNGNHSPEFTLRAILTGMLIGAALAPCNVYSGLKIGWSFNMSIAAGLLGAGFWRSLRPLGARPWGMLENNINQTTASSAASIISGGLVAPIPALAMMTGKTLPWHLLSVWVFAVSILGVVVAAGLRRQMLEREQLRFPSGMATAETMKRIHGRGQETVARLKALFTAGIFAATLKIAGDMLISLPRFAPALTLSRGVTAANLGLAFDPSMLMLGFGAIIGLRAGISLLLGAGLAWGVAAPYVLGHGWATPGASKEAWFGPLVQWLLWPGATLLVVSVLLSFLIFMTRLVKTLHNGNDIRRPSRPMMFGALASTALITLTAHVFFGITPLDALFGVLLTIPLAIVAVRVVGETGIPPIGALGKITQLSFAVISPANATTNLMSANITGGAAGQASDLMNDLKTGQMIGATPRLQIIAQVFGVLVGSMVGSLVYLILIPDPATMLLTDQWPAPAVATWKAVAEVLAVGLSAIPKGAIPAMAIAAALGIALALAENFLPQRIARRLPSAPAMGLAFVIPGWNSISLFLGAFLAYGVARIAPQWATRRTLTIATGLVAGESLAGIALAFRQLFS